MVPVGAVTAHVTADAPAIAPETPHMREKASSPPAFATSPHPLANTTLTEMVDPHRDPVVHGLREFLPVAPAAVA